MRAGEKQLDIVAHADGSYSASLDDGGAFGTSGSGLNWERVLRMVGQLAPTSNATSAQNPSMQAGAYGGSRANPPSMNAFSTTAEGDAHIKMMKDALKNTFAGCAGAAPILAEAPTELSELRQTIRLECLRLAGKEPPGFVSLVTRAAELEKWVVGGSK